METILVCGGAGYIGSCMTAQLVRNGFNVVVADNLSTGHASAVKSAELLTGDLRDADFLDGVFSGRHIDGVIDFAAFSQVGESVSRPLKYYENNIGSVVSLLSAMHRHEVSRLVFSSTAAIYGAPELQPISEDAPKTPTNPYGATKLAVEELLRWCALAYGIKYAALRYFNAAGADVTAGVGEAHLPETHLIPLVLRTAMDSGKELKIFGADYSTKDGTCVRDYVHVLDLCRAHLMALEHLAKGGESGAFNLGSGRGYSVREIIETAERVVGRKIPFSEAPRREGDPPVLIASNEKAGRMLGWKPEHDLEDMLSDAWSWHCAHPNGYSTEK